MWPPPKKPKDKKNGERHQKEHRNRGNKNFLRQLGRGEERLKNDEAVYVGDE